MWQTLQPPPQLEKIIWGQKDFFKVKKTSTNIPIYKRFFDNLLKDSFKKIFYIFYYTQMLSQEEYTEIYSMMVQNISVCPQAVELQCLYDKTIPLNMRLFTNQQHISYFKMVNWKWFLLVPTTTHLFLLIPLSILTKSS